MVFARAMNEAACAVLIFRPVCAFTASTNVRSEPLRPLQSIPRKVPSS
jgi:hypothetical protein